MTLGGMSLIGALLLAMYVGVFFGFLIFAMLPRSRNPQKDDDDHEEEC